MLKRIAVAGRQAGSAGTEASASPSSELKPGGEIPDELRTTEDSSSAGRVLSSSWEKWRSVSGVWLNKNLQKYACAGHRLRRIASWKGKKY